uniref:Uncharacterized protein n=1 Tax=Anguilla anguilla TaxID=7936 RepID=A0A0E9X616_ANGAN
MSMHQPVSSSKQSSTSGPSQNHQTSLSGVEINSTLTVMKTMQNPSIKQLKVIPNKVRKKSIQQFIPPLHIPNCLG